MSVLVFDTFRPVLVQPGSGVNSSEGNVVEMGNHKGNSLIKKVGGSVTVRKVDRDKGLIYVH